MTDNRTAELLQELCDLAKDINPSEIIDHMSNEGVWWAFDTQWLDSWHTEFDRIADELKHAIM